MHNSNYKMKSSVAEMLSVQAAAADWQVWLMCIFCFGITRGSCIICGHTCTLQM